VALEAVISDLAQPVERADPEAGGAVVFEFGLKIGAEVGIQEEFLSQPCYRHNCSQFTNKFKRNQFFPQILNRNLEDFL